MGRRQRLKGATDAILEKAFTDGEILHPHLLRPTWHIVKMSEKSSDTKREIFLYNMILLALYHCVR
jgi:hypothetical protein